MRNGNIPSLFGKIASSFFIFLFVYTATSKLLHPELFRSALSKMPSLHEVASILTYGIPLAELTVAAFLFLPSQRRSGLLLSGGMMLLFTGFVGIMLLTQSELPCSCGGIFEAMNWEVHLLFNSFCTAFAFTAWQKAANKNEEQINSFIRIKQGLLKTCNRVSDFTTFLHQKNKNR